MQEYVCDKCNGTGEDPNKTYEGPPEPFWSKVCDKCWGSGKLNWIERIFGKNEESIYTSIQLPQIRGIYPQLIAKELVSVQPMEEPVKRSWFKKLFRRE